MSLTTTDAVPWLMRAAWLSLPATAGAVLAEALDARSAPVAATAAVLAWGIWGAVLLALLVPRPAGAIALRLGSLAAVLAAAWSAIEVGRATGVAWLALTAVPAVLANLAVTGEWLVNGAAYGHERRYVLRPPAALLLGPLVLASVVAVAGLTAGPLLVAAGMHIAGAIAIAVGVPTAWLLFRALVRLAERWVVLVPAGLVVKDHIALLDPMLFRREDIESFGPAPADSDAVDLTAGTFGLALELRLRTPYQVSQVAGRAGSPQARQLDALLVTPTRPGALIADASRRRVPTG